MNKMPSSSPNLTKENIEKLKELFPEILTDGEQIDFDKLKTILGQEVNGEKERYSFNWHGKKDAILGAQKPSKGTLRPDKEKSKNFDTTENLYIEGDNLEVLKLLQKSYSNKIKMIYIDPPYNTGKDFVYKDNFRDGIENYLEQTGQTDGEGNRLSTNSESNGRYHTDWLNMMYPRLKLARNLLSEDGVIFISIDDSEQNRLKCVCDEIFGESNFIAQFIWNSSTGGGIRSKYVNINHQYVLAYSKNISKCEQWFAELSPEAIAAYKSEDEIGKYRGKDFAFKNSSKGTNQKYGIKTPDGDVIFPKNGYMWRFIEQRFLEELNKNNVIFKKSSKGPTIDENGNQANWNIYIKKYLNDGKGAPISIMPKNLVGLNNEGTTEVQKIFSGKRYFENPKTLKMLKYIFSLNVKSGDIILDFFSGSASSAHTVMKLNAEDGSNRKFIMVQLPEQLDAKSEAYKDGYRTICDIGEERIRRAGELVKQELIEKNNKSGMLADDWVDSEKLDVGFKVMKLDKSNIREWNSDFDDLEDSLFAYEDVFVEGRSELDVIYEIMLKNGLDLTYKVNQFEHDGRNIYDVAYGNLFVCLADDIDVSVAQGIINKRNEYGTDTSSVVLKDAGFKSDADKLNVIELLKDSGYPEENILSI